MATCATCDDGDLSLANQTKRLSCVDSLYNFDAACKSPAEMESEVKTKQEKIKLCISEAQKVLAGYVYTLSSVLILRKYVYCSCISRSKIHAK